jgi:hypothetical protein
VMGHSWVGKYTPRFKTCGVDFETSFFPVHLKKYCYLDRMASGRLLVKIVAKNRGCTYARLAHFAEHDFVILWRCLFHDFANFTNKPLACVHFVALKCSSANMS